MAAIDEREDRLLRVSFERGDGKLGGHRGFVPVAQPVHGGQQYRFGEGLHEMQVAGDRLAGERPRRHAPLDAGSLLKSARVHARSAIFSWLLLFPYLPWTQCQTRPSTIWRPANRRLIPGGSSNRTPWPRSRPPCPVRRRGQ